jgi:hypothetical protein
MDSKMPSKLSAEAILKSERGRSITEADVPITSENIEEFLPSAETISKAAELLEALGFEAQISDVTLTLSAEPSVFESVFRAKPTIETDERSGMARVRFQAEPTLPDSLKGVVESVVFPEPPELFP